MLKKKIKDMTREELKAYKNAHRYKKGVTEDEYKARRKAYKRNTETHKAWIKNNLERWQEYQKQYHKVYREKNRLVLNEYMKQWQNINKEKLKIQRKLNQKKNKNK